MTLSRRALTAIVLLGVEAGLVLLGVWVHYSFTAEYGRVGDTPLQGLTWGLTAGLSGIALALVAVVAVLALLLGPGGWMRVSAVALPVVMLLGMLALTPVALAQKTQSQYSAAPQCSSEDFGEPAATDVRQAQQAFDSIEHLGYFSGDGQSGPGGCDRRFALSTDLDVLEHYRAALPAAGWDVVEDDGQHLRAQRDGMAFEVLPCPGGGIAWAGPATGDDFGTQCAH